MWTCSGGTICLAEVWLEVHYTISQANLFQPRDYVAIGASGGKDSTVLTYNVKTLNSRLE